ncbi:hypothetical protein DFH29DRAFT_879371 [Suillus ampliporus]|nr:hypothetical protein DFH29DRAFT_879371 [Suillus ampliporus]
MFARLFAVASFVAFAVATSGQCNTGSIQCCQSSTSTSNYNSAAGYLGLAPVVADVVAVVGLVCSPTTVVGTGSGCEANQEPLCCTDNKYSVPRKRDGKDFPASNISGNQLEDSRTQMMRATDLYEVLVITISCPFMTYFAPTSCRRT